MNYNKRLVPICIIYIDGRRLNVGCEGAFRSVKVIDTLDNVGECTVRFDYVDLGAENWKALGTDCLESDISVHIGYKDDTREIFSGRVTRVSVKHPERGPSTCSVRAASYLSLLDHGTHIRAFENITPSQAIRDTLARYNLQMAEYESFGPVIPYWESYEKTDLQTVQYIAKRYGRDICCVGKKVYVKRLMTMR
ncbi:MAG: phage late control D family protein, partial [Treponema sp.]|nr:phage late control D family protein [Treponema sp.]